MKYEPITAVGIDVSKGKSTVAVAGAAKFLRIYYVRVKAHLMTLDSGTSTAA